MDTNEMVIAGLRHENAQLRLQLIQTQMQLLQTQYPLSEAEASKAKSALVALQDAAKTTGPTVVGK